jgi:hypothetical protein
MEFSERCAASDEEQLVCDEIFSESESDDTNLESDKEDMDTDTDNE